ncbi:MAG: hypothetical protein FWG49_01335 [Leptospirales bacterium]|nr:hypothetical protein [Leptospirales bacterium]
MNNENSNNEDSNKIEAALKYTNGDMDKAKLMAAGSMLDVIVIKGKFTAEDQKKSGAFLVFFNFIDAYISAMKSTAGSNDSVFTKTNILDSWDIIYKNILEYKSGEDLLSSEKLGEVLLNSFAQRDLFPYIQKEDVDYISSILPDILKESLDSSNIKCQIDFAKTNSLEVELAGIDVTAPPNISIEEPGESSVPEILFDPNSHFGEKITAAESQAEHIIDGSLVISPVKGKLISEIEKNEKIYVLLAGQDSISKKILDTYKSRDQDGNPRPFLGKVVSIIPNEINKGYIIYVIVAKGIYAKIIEEENLRIQTGFTSISLESGDEDSEKKKRGTKIFYWTVCGVFIALIISLIVVFAMI